MKIELEVHAGDFKTGEGYMIFHDSMYPQKNRAKKYRADGFYMKNKNGKVELFPFTEVEEIEEASEESVQRVGGALRWGLAGGVLFGPLGLITGLIAGGGQKNMTTFVCKFKDSRKFLGTCNTKTFTITRATIQGF